MPLLYVPLVCIKCAGRQASQGLGKNVKVESVSKYARVEYERRFLLSQSPCATDALRVRHITDLYIDSTALRLREQTESGRPTVFKFTQKIKSRAQGAQQGLITTIYVAAEEFSGLARLPGKRLSKTRYSVPPFGIDVFEGTLEGLCLAEAEFDSAAAADRLTIPHFARAEVTTDDRFTGGELVQASRGEIQAWLAEYGVKL